MKFNPNLRKIPESGIRRFFSLAEELAKSGKRIVRMDVGRPNYPFPQFLASRLACPLSPEIHHYSANKGMPGLRAAICSKLELQNKIKFCSERNVIVTAGASEAVFLAITTLLCPSDEVLIIEPSWSHYEVCARLNGNDCKGVPLDLATGEINWSAFEALAGRNTKMIIINSPGNPTGQHLLRKDVSKLISFVKSHNCYLLVDEIYEYFDYRVEADRVPHPYSEIIDKLIYINGFSKAFCMTGWRLGYLCGPEDFIKQANKLHQYTMVCANVMAQNLGEIAYTSVESENFIESQVSAYKERLHSLLKCAQDLGLTGNKPTGSFYWMLKLPSYLTSVHAGLKLLEEGLVATVPGSTFGPYGEGYLRLSYGSCEIKEIEIALHQIRKVLF